MTPAAILRSRRNAAQRHALVRLELEIRAADPHTRRKYLRDFRSAFRDYESVLDAAQLNELYAQADVLLIGDYHALPRSQKFAAEVIAQLAPARPVVLGVETVFTRDQEIVDGWQRHEIDERELRERLRFDLDWGYEWPPFYHLLAAARSLRVPIYGLDCLPRNDLRRIALRDRHAAARIAEIRERHPDAVVVVLFGESHLAPSHLPLWLRAHRPQDRLLTVLQNVDSLYWRAAGERSERVEAVRVGDGVICVFNATPLEKYESYRLCLARWRHEGSSAPDLAPAFYNMVDALLRFLNIDKCSPSTGTQPVIDQLPEICFHPTPERVRRLLRRAAAGERAAAGKREKETGENKMQLALAQLDARGCCYVPELRAVLMRDLDLVHGAEEAARFVHHACRLTASAGDAPEAGRSGKRPPADSPAPPIIPPTVMEDAFYTRVLEHALAYFGSRALYPARPAMREIDLFGLFSLSRKAVAALGFASHRDFMRTVDFLVLHKDYEANLPQYRERPPLLAEGVRCRGEAFRYATRQLGYLLGSELYDAYISGRLSKRFLRSLFFRRLEKAGAARIAYFAVQQKLRLKKRSA